MAEYKCNENGNDSAQSKLANEKTGCQTGLQEIHLQSAI